VSGTNSASRSGSISVADMGRASYDFTASAKPILEVKANSNFARDRPLHVHDTDTAASDGGDVAADAREVNLPHENTNTGQASGGGIRAYSIVEAERRRSERAAALRRQQRQQHQREREERGWEEEWEQDLGVYGHGDTGVFGRGGNFHDAITVEAIDGAVAVGRGRDARRRWVAAGAAAGPRGRPAPRHMPHLYALLLLNRDHTSVLYTPHATRPTSHSTLYTQMHPGSTQCLK